MKTVAIIPSLNERTSEIAIKLVKDQVFNVVVLEKLSRAESIRTAWEISKDYDYMIWTPTDLLIHPGVIRKLLNDLIDSGKDRIVSKCISKFRGMTVGGITIQKTHMNDQLIKTIDKNSLRPESDTALKLLSNVKSDVVVGYHEYFLDYEEIYLRFQHHRKKHHKQVGKVINLWKQKALTDLDFEAAVTGYLNRPFVMGSKGNLTFKEIRQIIDML